MKFALVRTDTQEAFSIGDDAVFVGRADWKTDLCLASDEVDEVHCELVADRHGIRVMSLSPDGVLVNGLPLQSALLFPSDRLTVGPFSFRVERFATDSSLQPVPLPVTLHARASTGFQEPGSDHRGEGNVTRNVVVSESPVPEPPDGGPDPVDGDPVDGGLVDGGLVDGGLVDGGAGDDRPGVRSLTSPRRVTCSAVTRPVRSVPVDPAGQSEVSLPAVAEPQYFVRRASADIGPLPRNAVQELAHQGQLSPDDPVRLEWKACWSNAVDLGFICPQGATKESSEKSQTQPAGADGAAGSAGTDGLSTAPLRRAVRKQTVLVGLLCLTAGWACRGWLTSTSAAAISGRVFLEDQPLGLLAVTLTGEHSKEVAVGTADRDGHFTVLAPDGGLSPGRYRVTVCPLAGFGATVPHGDRKQLVPEQYARLATSDAVVDVVPGQVGCRIQLRKVARSSLPLFRKGSMLSMSSAARVDGNADRKP